MSEDAPQTITSDEPFALEYEYVEDGALVASVYVFGEKLSPAVTLSLELWTALVAHAASRYRNGYAPILVVDGKRIEP